MGHHHLFVFPSLHSFLGDKVRLNERHPSLRNKKSVTDRAMIAVREFTRWKNIHTKEAQKNCICNFIVLILFCFRVTQCYKMLQNAK